MTIMEGEEKVPKRNSLLLNTAKACPVQRIGVMCVNKPRA
jgi:hypothetical protein